MTERLSTSSGPDLDMQRIDAKFLASGRYILRSQHGCVGAAFISIGLHFHPARDSADCFTATGITQNVSL